MRRRLIAASLLLGACIAIAIAVATAGTPSFDTRIGTGVASLRNGVFGSLLNGLSAIGYVQWFAPIVAVIVGALVVRGRRGAAAQLVLSVVVANLAFAAGKRVFHRARPEFADHVVGGYSMPSGHATMAFALAATLLLTTPQLRRPWLAGLLAAYALLTAVSRIVLGVHYVSDVVAGACLGVACALAVDAFVAARRG